MRIRARGTSIEVEDDEGALERRIEFQDSVGFLHGLIAASRTRVIEVPPQTWQKTIQAGTKATHGTRWKAHLKGIAQQRQPRLVITLKTADAVLLLEHAMLSEGVK